MYSSVPYSPHLSCNACRLRKHAVARPPRQRLARPELPSAQRLRADGFDQNVARGRSALLADARGHAHGVRAQAAPIAEALAACAAAHRRGRATLISHHERRVRSGEERLRVAWDALAPIGVLVLRSQPFPDCLDRRCVLARLTRVAREPQRERVACTSRNSLHRMCVRLARRVQ